MKTDELIKKLTENHRAKPIWKNAQVLFPGWFILNLLFFLISLLTEDHLQLSSSVPLVILQSVVILLSWMIFVRNLKGNFQYNGLTIVGMISLAVMTLFIGLKQGVISHNASAAVSIGELSCFSHIMFSIIPSLILFAVLIKNFFVFHPWSLGAIAAMNLSFLGLSAMELKCHNRELWHLLLGHYSTIIFVVALVVGVIFLRKNLKPLAS